MNKLLKEARIGGRTYYLAYTVQAMLETKQLLKNEDGTEQRLTDLLESEKEEDYRTFCGIVSALARAGELLRRALGYEKGTCLNQETVYAELMPYEEVALKQACLDAVILGLTGEGEEKEVDLGLAELQKKTP